MFRHIRTKILVLTLPVVFVTILFEFAVSVNFGKNIIDSQIQERIESQQLVQVSIIENKLECARSLSEDLSSFVRNSYKNYELETYEEIIKELIPKDNFILGSGIWFEPYAYESSQKYVGSYVYKDGDELVTTDDYNGAAYDYFSQEYYLKVKDTKNVIFTDPYYDETSDLYMLTCATPLWDELGKFLGCVTVDIQLNELQSLVSSLATKEGESAFLLGSDGVYLASEDMNRVKNGVKITQENNKSLQEAGNVIIREKSGITSFTDGEETYRLYFTTIPELNWKVIYQISGTNVLAPIYDLMFILLIIGAISLIVLSGSVLLIVSRNIVKPIKSLVNEFELIASKEYDYPIPSMLVRKRDEFGFLGRALIEMKLCLSQSHKEIEDILEENIAARDELIRQNNRLKTSEEHLMESIRYNQSIMQVIPDILFIISRDGIFLDCQGSTETLLYRPKEEFIGKSMFDMIPEHIAKLAMQKIQEALEKGTLQSFEYEINIAGNKEFFELRIMQCFADKIMAISRRITDEHRHQTQIEYLNFHDQITQLYNRRFFEEELERLDKAKFLPVGIIFADVNGLKLVNDSFGHGEGDRLLIKFAKVLKSTCGETARIARIGGDEFVLLFPNAHENDIEKLVEEISDNCGKETVQSLTLSVSLGWGIKENSSQQLRDVLKLAEDMMYKKKMFEAPSRRGKTIDVIISTLLEKNPREEQHSHRVAALCNELASALNLSNHERMKIKSAGLLHDIGKIGIPEEILNKKGNFTSEEYQIICKHPEIGYRILQSAHDMGEIAEIILAHHERWDGLGYPRGLKAEEIPYIARMIAIADTYDAMTSERSYRAPLTEKKAAREMLKNAGIQFDPDLVYYFVHDVLKFNIEE